jgi:hypothetical protein
MASKDAFAGLHVKRLIQFGYSFLVLFILFIFALETNEEKRINFAEACFIIYGLGFALEKIAAMQEQ